MADYGETSDASYKEQVVLCFRWVSDDLTDREDFIGFYQRDTIEANSLVNIIKEALLRLNLSISKVRGQCHDGASAMRSAHSGVAKQIRDMEERIYTHRPSIFHRFTGAGLAENTGFTG